MCDGSPWLPNAPELSRWRGSWRHYEHISHSIGHLDGLRSLHLAPCFITTCRIHADILLLQLQPSVVIPTSRVPSPSSRSPSLPQPPSHGTSLVTMPMPSAVCTFTNSVTTPTAAHLPVLTVSSFGLEVHGSSTDIYSQPTRKDTRCSIRRDSPRWRLGQLQD